MLIIAIPKSASTSLLYTLGSFLNFPAVQKFKESREIDGFKVLQKLHSDIGDYSEDQINEFLHPYRIFKQHLPPTTNNLYLLKTKKKVVLLRNPEDIIYAYKRGAQSEVHTLLKGFDKNWSDEKWLLKAKEIGLFDELTLFNELWRKEETKFTLVINYNELIGDPTLVLNKILEFYEYPRKAKKLKLVKARYSRVSFLRKLLRKVKKKLYA